MTDPAARHPAPIIPTIGYRDAPTAIDFLCHAFGFERHLVVARDDGSITHAQLRFGNGMIMLRSAREEEFGRWQRGATDLRGTTEGAYVIVPDADAHFARAKAAGALIVLPLKDEVYGGRVYSCRDPEGHLWNFGTYDPWRATSVR